MGAAQQQTRTVAAGDGPGRLPTCRVDLIPPVALERLALHNELCGLKFADPAHWKREGFPASYRIDSLKRHFGAWRRRGVAWRGVAWRGVAWRGICVAWRGAVQCGVAWRGVAWRGVRAGIHQQELDCRQLPSARCCIHSAPLFSLLEWPVPLVPPRCCCCCYCCLLQTACTTTT